VQKVVLLKMLVFKLTPGSKPRLCVRHKENSVIYKQWTEKPEFVYIKI